MKDKEGKKYTHVMFVFNDPDITEPVYGHSAKEVSDKGDDIIRKNPAAECDIFMLHTELKGEIKIHRQHHVK